MIFPLSLPARCVFRRKSLLLGSALALAAPLACPGQQPPAKAPPEYAFSVNADRPDALYHVGETVTFHVALNHGPQPAGNEEISWTISKDGFPPERTGQTTLQQGQADLTGKLDEPGFVRCEVQFKHEKDVFKGLAAAGVDPLGIKPSMPAPADFDAFWTQKVKELEAIPLHAQLTSVPVPPIRAGAEAFDVQCDCVGKPMSGYYGRPAGAQPHSLPAMVIFHGAGVDSANLDQVCGWAKAGFICLDINAHGIPNGKPREFYNELAAGELKTYRTEGSASRDTYYFLGMYLRAQRALDFLTAQPEWDGRTLVANGGSQGGAQAIASAGLDKRVSFLVAIEPAMCDHTGLVIGRPVGWPKLVLKGPDGKPDPATLQAARYFDSVNFAARVKAPAFFSVGFLDALCPPTTVYAAYNNVATKKDMNDEIHGGHNVDPLPGTPNIWGEVRKRILDYAAQVKAAPGATH